jgi:alkylation response protein AidB-like acyl-CoA dehydrogenase
MISSPALPCSSLDEHWRRHLSATGDVATTIEQAMVGGAVADRPAYAFASGYQAALHSLVPGLPRASLASLCVTESGGGHPRAIETTLVGRRLVGEKKFATMSPVADVLLIAASEGDDGAGRKRLRLVEVPRLMPGITIEPMDELPFVPEVPHAKITLDVDIDGETVLPGDGWLRFVKPFRTVEDLHVSAAIAAHVLAVASSHGFPRDLRERMLAGLTTLRALAAEPADDPAVHLALAGALATMRQTINDTESAWKNVPDEIAARWERDRAVLTVARTVREKRTEAAWAALG